MAKGLAVNGNQINGVQYTGTVESLVAGISSVLAAKGRTPTTLVPAPPEEIFETAGVTWGNASGVPWREVGQRSMKAGGLMSSTFSSVLTAAVHGRGKFVFSYTAVSCSSENQAVFTVNGQEVFRRRYDGQTTYSGTLTNEVTSAGGATFTWTCVVGTAEYDYTDNYSSSCGFIVHDVEWIPEASGITVNDGLGGEVTIPSAWFAGHGLAAAGADAAALAAAAAANWQEYICGTDPIDPAEKLAATIAIVDGEAVVEAVPKSGYAEGYQPVVKGKSTLGAGGWETRSPLHRFFRVFVERK